jgi:hypothetical protein
MDRLDCDTGAEGRAGAGAMTLTQALMTWLDINLLAFAFFLVAGDR